MECDICSQRLNRGEGFLLTTAQVVSSPLYWKQVLEKSPFATLGASSNPTFKASLASQMASQRTPWLICDDCIDLFAIDRSEARQFALTFHENRGNFAPPGSGPVPLSKVNMGDGKVFIQGGSPEAMELSRQLRVRAEQSKTSCFIATAAFSASAPEVETLRRFRNRVLMQHPMGKRFVALYYKISPRVAAWIAPSPLRRKLIRCALYPIIDIAQRFGARGRVRSSAR